MALFSYSEFKNRLYLENMYDSYVATYFAYISKYPRNINGPILKIIRKIMCFNKSIES